MKAKPKAEQVDKIKATIRVPVDIWDSVRICAIEERTSAEAIVLSALNDWFRSHEFSLTGRSARYRGEKKTAKSKKGGK